MQVLPRRAVQHSTGSSLNWVIKTGGDVAAEAVAEVRRARQHLLRDLVGVERRVGLQRSQLRVEHVPPGGHL
jgi:hypothetical protein